MTNAADIAFAHWQAEEEIARQRAVIQARAYYEGDAFSFITDRLELFFGVDGDDLDFNLNVCRAVIHAITERMIVTGFESTDADFATWAWMLWNLNRMDAKQGTLFNEAGAAGSHFVIVEWNGKYPEWIIHPRYTGTQDTDNLALDGTGDGISVKYINNDANQGIEYYSNRWLELYTDAQGHSKQRNRMTLYYPDRIERYQLISGGWELYSTPDEPSSVPQLYSDGEPLGFPVFMFATSGERSDIADAIAPQDAINKTIIDALAVMDIAGGPIFPAFGFYPTSDGKAPEADGSNRLTLSPGMFIGSSNENGRLEKISGEPVTPLLDAIEKLMSWTASITGTPASRFSSAQVESADAQKERKESLIAKIQTRESGWGDVFEDMIEYSAKLQNLYGGGDNGTQLNIEAEVNTQWADPSPRNELETMQVIEIKVNSLQIPKQQAWREAGYTQEQIDQMLLDIEAQMEMQARVAAINTAPPVVDESFVSQGVVSNTPAQSGGGSVPVDLQAQAAAKEVSLNGAQITAALDILNKIQTGEILPPVAVELLVAVGIARGVAENMVKQNMKAKGA